MTAARTAGAVAVCKANVEDTDNEEEEDDEEEEEGEDNEEKQEEEEGSNLHFFARLPLFSQFFSRAPPPKIPPVPLSHKKRTVSIAKTIS